MPATTISENSRPMTDAAWSSRTASGDSLAKRLRIDSRTPAGTGPNLAEALKGKDAAYIHESIVDPDAVIYQGFQPGIMPQDFEQQLPPKNLDELVKYVLDQVQQGG